MKQSLDRFILALPLLFIKQFPYAWILVIALWSWPPNASAVFSSIIVIGLIAMQWQSAAWLSNTRREHALRDGKFYVDRPGVPIKMAVQRLTILILISGLLAFLFKGYFDLSFWQIFFLLTGFSIFYRDTMFFGAPTTYVITDEGIGIRFAPSHIDYRLFLNFKEINSIKKTMNSQEFDWNIFARPQNVKEGLLLIPKDPNGFSKRIKKLFIAPKDMQKFLEQLPPSYIMNATRSG